MKNVAHRIVVLSMVSNEFKSYRILLARDLQGPRLDAKSQEDFIATGGTTLQKLVNYIEPCDAVIHLIGDATGECPEKHAVKQFLENPKYSNFCDRVPVLKDVLANCSTEISYTQWEAYLALYFGKQLFVYTPEPTAPKDATFKFDSKQRDLQDRHLKRLKSLDKDRGTFLNQERLSSFVLRGLFDLDWGDTLPLKIDLHELPSCDCPELFGREHELKLLDKAWAERTHMNVFCLVAAGGDGKTSLIHEWRKLMHKEEYRGARRVYGYSFYNQGTTNANGAKDLVTSADDFFTKALAFFGAPELEKANAEAKGAGLAQVVRQQRTLLFLDGLEPLQVPALTGVPVEKRKQPGTLTDNALRDFLKELAASNPGLCVISTRIKVAELNDFDASTVKQHLLKPLTHKDGAKLLKNRGVKGSPKELKQASEELKGHGLTLTLLGNLLSKFYNGDVSKRSEVLGELEEDVERGGHAWKVMDSYEQWFREGAELNVLRILGLFDRPADKKAVDALLAPPAIPGLTDLLFPFKKKQEWEGVLAVLRDHQLLAQVDPSQPNILDTHPLVREHFGRRLQKERPQVWREGNTRLYEHFKTQAPQLPTTIEQMKPLFLAVRHGCEAGRHEDVLDQVYWPRILRGVDYYSTDELGAFGDDLTAASFFFARQWNEPLANLTPLQQARVQSAAGWDLRGLGRMDEAIDALQGSMDKYAGLEDAGPKEWGFANVSCSQIAQIHLDRGDLRLALQYAEQKEHLAMRSGGVFWVTGAYVLRALILFQMGGKHLAECEELCRKVEANGFAEDVGDAVDHTFIAFRWCDLLLGQIASPCSPATPSTDKEHLQRVLDEIENRCAQIVRKAGQPPLRPHPATEAAKLLRGRALLVRALNGQPGLDEAKNRLDAALEYLKRGTQELYLSGLRARTAYFLEVGDLKAAETDLMEALKVAERGGMRLYEVDFHLQFARLHNDRDDKRKARDRLARARELIRTLGYHRRDHDLAELETLVEG